MVVPIGNVAVSEQMSLKDSNKIIVNGDILFKYKEGSGSSTRVVYQTIYKGQFYICLGTLTNENNYSAMICFENLLNKKD